MTNKDAIEMLKDEICGLPASNPFFQCVDLAIKALENQPRWIPISEALPVNVFPVNITWVNHKPEPYYSGIKDVPFTATGCFCDGKWYWYSSCCEDYLIEYRKNYADEMDESIEVLAWMPLPKPYTKEETT